MRFDVFAVQVEARAAVEHAAGIFVTHLGQSVVTIVAHGSAVKGGYIPFGSDIDLDLIVTPHLLGQHGELPLETVVEIHRDLAAIDPAPFRYLQTHVHPFGARTGTGLIPGAYQVVYGDVDVPLATDVELRRNAHTALSKLDLEVISARMSNRLLDHGEDRLYRELRFLCTNIWPTLYHIVSITGEDAVVTWGLPKQAAIACIDAETDIGHAIHTFYSTITAHYRAGETVETALKSVAQGIAFLQETAKWYRSAGPKKCCASE